MINPQTGCHSPSFIETKKVKNIFNDYAKYITFIISLK